MKNFEREDFEGVAQAASEAKQVFFPNRYQDQFIDVWRTLTGEDPPEMEGRKESILSGGRLWRWVRGRNVPLAVDVVSAANPGAKIVGMTGSEWVNEYRYFRPDTAITSGRASEERLGTVSVIAPPGTNIPQLETRLNKGISPVGVVTVYPGLVGALALSDRGNMMVGIEVDGCVEAMAAAMEMPGVDLVSPEARTIKANDFSLVRELVVSYPALVMGPAPGVKT